MIISDIYAPNFKEIEGHIDFGSFVRPSVLLSVCPIITLFLWASYLDNYLI